MNSRYAADFEYWVMESLKFVKQIIKQNAKNPIVVIKHAYTRVWAIEAKKEITYIIEQYPK